MSAPILNPELTQKLNSFHVLWIRYHKSYFAVLGTLEDKSIRLKTHKYGESDEIELNEDTLLYTDQAIRLMEFLKNSSLVDGLEPNDLPFVHRLLRKWRNINHHKKYLPFRLTSIADGNLNVDGTIKKAEDYPLKFYLYATIRSNEGLESIARDFGKMDRYTFSTLDDLIKIHHSFMLLVFETAERNLNNLLPERYTLLTSIGGHSCGISTKEREGGPLSPQEFLDFSDYAQKTLAT
mgnify:CR=1 FL=1